MSGTLLQGTLVGAQTAVSGDPPIRVSAVGNFVAWALEPPLIVTTFVGNFVAMSVASAPARRARPRSFILED